MFVEVFSICSFSYLVDFIGRIHAQGIFRFCHHQENISIAVKNNMAHKVSVSRFNQSFPLHTHALIIFPVASFVIGIYFIQCACLSGIIGIIRVDQQFRGASKRLTAACREKHISGFIIDISRNACLDDPSMPIEVMISFVFLIMSTK